MKIILKYSDTNANNQFIHSIFMLYVCTDNQFNTKNVRCGRAGMCNNIRLVRQKPIININWLPLTTIDFQEN